MQKILTFVLTLKFMRIICIFKVLVVKLVKTFKFSFIIIFFHLRRVWTIFVAFVSWTRLWIAPSIKSRRAVSNGGPFLCLAYALTCFVKFFQRYKRCSENAWMRLSIVPSTRSRRAVSNGGFLLSVAYALTCFMRFFLTTLLRKCMNEAVDSAINQISSSCVEW